jgi:hypothetical protein
VFIAIKDILQFTIITDRFQHFSANMISATPGAPRRLAEKLDKGKDKIL